MQTVREWHHLYEVGSLGSYREPLLWQVLHPMTRLASYDKSCILWQDLHPMTSLASYDKSCILWQVLHPMTSLASYDKSCILWQVLFPENTRKKCPLETYKILIKSISDESYTPHTPSFGDGGNRYTSFGMGLTPSKYRQKIKNWNRVWRNCDLGDESSMKFGSFGDEWGRHGSEWAHTLGKRRHGLQEGF